MFNIMPPILPFSFSRGDEKGQSAPSLVAGQPRSTVSSMRSYISLRHVVPAGIILEMGMVPSAGWLVLFP